MSGVTMKSKPPLKIYLLAKYSYNLRYLALEKIVPPSKRSRRGDLNHKQLPSFLDCASSHKEGKISVAARQLILGWFDVFFNYTGMHFKV